MKKLKFFVFTASPAQMHVWCWKHEVDVSQCVLIMSIRDAPKIYAAADPLCIWLQPEPHDRFELLKVLMCRLRGECQRLPQHGEVTS